jgi:hypothetical protein
VISVADPSLPVEVGFCETTGEFWDLAVAGNYAYIADSFGYLRIIDISNSAAPVETGMCEIPGSAWGVAVAGNYAYVAALSHGLRVVDISNPFLPVEVGFYDLPGGAVGVAIVGNFVYLAAIENGLHVISIVDPTSPVEVGFYDTRGETWDISVVGNLAYVADGELFGIYDCSEATQAVHRAPEALPQTVTLYPCYPNPFNPMTTISFDLPMTSEVSLVVYNVNGQAVETLVNEQRPAGTFNVSFDGSRLSSGTYFYTLNAGGYAETRKMVMLK